MSDRAGRLAELLAELGVDLLLVTELVNVRYLTGYTGSSGLALVGADRRVFITDFRYVEQAAEEVDPSFERRRAPRELIQEITGALPDRPLRLGFEEQHVSVRTHAQLLELLPERVELVAVDGLIERLRAVKEPDEIERIRLATALADAAFERVLAEGLLGRTERQIALALEVEMRTAGASRPSFEAVVAAGPHGALPHASPRDVEIGAGEVVVIDWGAELDGYCSDCTRTVATGEPDERVKGVYGLVLEAQLAGLGAVRAGAECRRVDSLAREIIDAAGHGEHFGHGLGHGVGLEIHEAPRLSQTYDGTLADGNVVTVEPGVYLPGAFGVRIEDLVVVRGDTPEILTSLGKELTVVD